MKAGPAAERRRRTAQVDRDVEDLALQDLDELPLRLLHLVVQAADHVPARQRAVVLHELGVDAGCLSERSLVVALEERAAVVFEYARLEQQDLRYFGALDLHQNTRSDSTFSRYSP